MHYSYFLQQFYVFFKYFSILFLVCLIGFGCYSPSYYKGPISDHYDGKKFYNPSSTASHNFLSLLKWQWSRKKPQWPVISLENSFDLIMPIPYVTKEDEIRATMVGHATVLLQIKNINILTDPVWSERASPFSFMGPKRVIAPGIMFDNLPPIDLVIISHNHYDHMDAATVRMLVKKHNPLFITPLGNDSILKKIAPTIRVHTLDWYTSHEATLRGTPTKIWCYPAFHWSARGLRDKNKALWGAFIIETSKGPIYFAGDTGFGKGEHFKKAQEDFRKFALALLPMGAFTPRWFMEPSHIDPAEAVEALQLLHADHAVALHFGVFPLADDAYHMPQHLLMEALQPYPSLSFITLTPGEEAIF